jgi:ribosome assembly protein SQT1
VQDVITSIAAHPAPNRHLFTTGSADKSLRTWDARTGVLIGEHKGHAGVINDVKVGRAPTGWGVEEDAVAKDGDVVVSAGDDGAVLVWRV